ncbi:MAG TPA: hypothetical protein VHJ39_11420 [Solirubrobacteraceae bacterium]|jgi:hypothetical protein|nr:hypothetical protein [Solirubrobacteraceae bacterium]
MFAPRRTATQLVLASALVLFAAPVATAQQDLRNPDNRRPPQTRQDLRMPDRQAPAPPPSQPRTYRDLRSADARDDRRVVTIVASSKPSDPSFDFGDAAIGAGIIGALALLGGTTVVSVRRRRPAAVA